MNPVICIKTWEQFCQAGKNIAFRDHSQLQSDKFKPEDAGISQYALFANEGLHSARLVAYFRPEFKAGFLGWFEAVNDEEVVHSMLEKAIDWLSQNGATQIIGPMDGLTWDGYRFNVTDAHQLYPGEPAQPVYYPDYWKSFGFQNSEKYFSSVLRLNDLPSMTNDEINKRLGEQDLNLLNLSPSVYEQYSEAIYNMVIRSFRYEQNPWFVPIAYDQFRERFDPIARNIPDGFAYLVIDHFDKPVSLFLTYPATLNQPEDENIHGYQAVIAKTLIIAPSWKNQKLGKLISRLATAKGKEAGMTFQVNALMHEQNPSLQIFKGVEPVLTREYQMLQYLF